MGQGYVGLPLAMRAVEAGYDVVGYDVDPTGSSASAPASPSSRTSPTSSSRPRCDAVATARRDVRARLRRLRRRRDHRADAAARRRARPVATSRRPPRTLGPLPAPRARRSSWSRPPIPAPPRSWSRRILEEGSGLTAGADFHLGYSPERIDPGNPLWSFVQHAEGRVRDRRRVARGASRPSTTTLVDTDGAGRRHRRRPSSPSCSRTPSGT